VNPALLRHSKNMNESVRVRFPWSRRDTIVKLTTDPLPGSSETPAWYYPTKADIHLNIERILGEDWDEDAFYNSNIQTTLWGFVAHEALHSLFSDWHIEAPKSVHQTLMLFEELRIEKRGVDRGVATYLRRSFAWILKDMLTHDGELATSRWAIAHNWALAYGRLLAGVAVEKEVKAIDELARIELGDFTVDMLREILSEAIVLHIPKPGKWDRERQLETLRLLAVEWLEILGIDPEAQPPSLYIFIENGDATTPAPGPGEGEAEDEAEDEAENEKTPGAPTKGELGSVPEEDEGTPDKTPYVEIDSETAELLREALEETAEAVDSPMPDEPPEPIRLADPTKWVKIFKSTEDPDHSWGTKDPTHEQRTKARKLATTLETLSLPTIARRKVRSAAPPGRLRGRAAVRQAADRDRGVMTDAEPWERTKRHRTHAKPVVVGVMTDVSGSMGWAQEFVGEFAWVVGTAGLHIGARTAAVTFGDEAEAVLQPGEVPQKIKVRSANGSSEAFDHAAAAIEGVLHLSAPTTHSKVLFVVSDGQLVRANEPRKAQRWIERWTAAGTIIVWVDGSSSEWSLYEAGVRRPGVLHRVPVPMEQRGHNKDMDQLYRNLSREITTAAAKAV
jgi:hypothetical protein